MERNRIPDAACALLKVTGYYVSRISFVGKITRTGYEFSSWWNFYLRFGFFPTSFCRGAAGFTFRRGIFFFFLPFFYSPILPSGKKSNPGAMFNRDSSGQISFPVFDGRLTDERALSISRHGFRTWNNLMKRKPLASPTTRWRCALGEEKKNRNSMEYVEGERVFINR